MFETHGRLEIKSVLGQMHSSFLVKCVRGVDRRVCKNTRERSVQLRSPLCVSGGAQLLIFNDLQAGGLHPKLDGVL